MLLSTALLALLAACGGGPGPGPEDPPLPDPDALLAWAPDAFPWPMYGQNPRRTNVSPFTGPQSYTAASPRNWVYRADGGTVINMQAIADAAGVYIGSWGALRRTDTDTPDLWNKFDGRWYGLHWDNRGASQERFAPLEPAFHPTGYLYASRPKLDRDVAWCGADNDFHVSFYNGTIEGTPVIDPRTGWHWLGRGDGRLFAITPDTGEVKHTFVTFNPQLPDDPDGGGEIVGGPVMAPDGLIYFGTFAAPWPGTPTDPAYETNAVYAVNNNGVLVWRYPSQDATLENILAAPPALSPDGKTLYVGTFAGDSTQPGRVIALDLTQPPTATDAERTRWSFELFNTALPSDPTVWVRHLAVGLDGTIFVGGAQAEIGGATTVVTALTPAGAHAWTPAVRELHPGDLDAGDWTGGMALEESGGATQRVYVTATHHNSIIRNGDGAKLYVLDAATGAIEGTFSPNDLATPAFGGLNGPTLDASGTCFVGTRGLHHHADPNAFVDGTMFGIRFNPQTGLFTELWRAPVEGNMDWAHPIVGAQGGLYFGSSDRMPLLLFNNWFGFGDPTPNRNPAFYGLFE